MAQYDEMAKIAADFKASVDRGTKLLGELNETYRNLLALRESLRFYLSEVERVHGVISGEQQAKKRPDLKLILAWPSAPAPEAENGNKEGR